MIELRARDMQREIESLIGRWTMGDYSASTILTHPREAVQVSMAIDTFDPNQMEMFDDEPAR